MSNLYIQHHGIKGQKWGKRNGPPYPLDYDDHSAAQKRLNPKRTIDGKRDETTKKKGLSDAQKKALKIGAIAAGAALAGIAAYKLGAIDKLVSVGKTTMSSLPEGVQTFKFETFEPEHIFPKDLGGVTNPKGLKNNCKDVAEATLKRWLGVDPGAVAGEKSTVGNLHDFIEKRGYNSNGVHWLGEDGGITPDPSGDSTGRVTRQILRKFKDGDCGMIGVSWDPSVLPPGSKEDGHAFNWFISKGQVIFYDDQPDPPVTDASRYFKLIAYKPDSNGRLPQIEVAQITKEAFAK